MNKMSWTYTMYYVGPTYLFYCWLTKLVMVENVIFHKEFQVKKYQPSSFSIHFV